MYLKQELYELIRTDESIFDFIQESTLDGLWYWDLEQPENEWMNPKFWRVLGYDPEEMAHTPSSWHHIINQDDLKLALENFTQHFENPDLPFDLNVRYRHKDGSTVWIRCRGLAIRDENGKPLRMLGAHVDITDVKKREEELLESKQIAENNEARYRTLFENMNTGFVLFEMVQNEQGIPVDLIILAANKRFEETTGLNLKDATGKYLTKVLPGIEKDEADWIGTYSKVALTGESIQYEQGSELLGYYYSISAFPAGPKQCAVTFLDVTERKNAEKQLSETNQYLENLINYTNAPILVWDVDYKIMRLNKVLERLTGLNASNALGKTIDILFPDSSLKETMDFIKKTGISHEQWENVEIPIRHIDGSVKIVLWNKANIYDTGGNNIISTIVQGLDITERKRLETEREKLAMLVDSSSEFIGMCDLNLQPIYVNPSGIQMVGLANLAEACEVRVQDYFFDEDQQFITEEFFPRVMREGHGDMEIRLRHFRTGEPIWVLYYLYRVCDSNGIPEGWATLSRDITERKRVEEDLIRMSRIMKNTQEIAHLGSFEFVAEDQSTIWSEEEYRIYGLDPNGPSPDYEVMLEKCIHPEDAGLLHETFMNAMLNQGIYELEHRIVRPDGSVRWVYDKAHPYFDNQSKLLRYVGATLDITERKEAEEILQEKEYLLSSSQRAAHVGTWNWKIGDTKIYWSDETYRIYGLNPDMGAPSFDFFFEIIHPEDRPKMQEWPTLLLEGLNPPPIEFRVRHPDGIYRVIQTDGDVTETVDGVPSRIAGTAFDITERKQAEEKLRESESRYRKIFEDGANGMVMVGKDFKFLQVNRSFCAMLGYMEEELQNLTFVDITHPDDKDKDVPYVKKMIAGEIDVYRTEKRYLSKKGQIIWAQLTLSPFYDSTGQFLYNIGIVLNITERKNAEKNLADSEERLRLATEHANIAVWEYDFTTNLISRSMNHDRLYGLPWQSKWDMNIFLNVIHPEDREYANQFIQNSVAPGGPDNYSFDFRVVLPNQSIRWLSANGKIIERDEKACGVAVRGTLADISEIKRTELDLKEMSRLLKNSQEIAHLGGFEFVIADQTTIWSEEEYRIFGLDIKEESPDYDVLLEKFIHPHDAKLVHESFTTAMHSQEVYELEHRIVRPDGSIRWVYNKAHPYFDNYGDLRSYVGATLDITERKHLQEELEILNTELELKVKQRTAQLEASNKELEAFSYSVSHDLRAPLRHINGYVDLLNQRFRDQLPEKAHHYLDTISAASSQMGTLIDDLLQYSKMGRKELSKTELDFRMLFKEVFEELRNLIKGRKIAWNIQELPKVIGDPTLLKLVWTNLLENAIKYTKNKSTAEISVGYREDEESFVFYISDNGVGFDMKYAQKLFGVFQRLHSQADFEGTGIGLANVQRIIHKHSGEVWATAETNKGAKFYFSLPKYPNEIS